MSNNEENQDQMKKHPKLILTLCFIVFIFWLYIAFLSFREKVTNAPQSLLIVFFPVLIATSVILKNDKK